MASAAITPRVRNVIVCDEVIPSATENGVYTLLESGEKSESKGVRSTA